MNIERLNGRTLGVLAKGTNITTGGSAAQGVIPNDSSGKRARRVRLAATAACYVRGVKPTDGSMLIGTAGTGYQTGDQVTLAGGTVTTRAVVQVTSAKLTGATVNAIGSGYVANDTITLGEGTASSKAVLTVNTTQLASTVLNAAGTGYVPGDTITMAGGTSSVKAIATLVSTKVVSATVNAAGTGGTPGANQFVDGTTGTGTKFRARVTINGGGGIASVDEIVIAGAYTANPTTIGQEPVVGANLTGAKLNVVMGVNTFNITTKGSYTVNSAALTQFATSGAGTGATFQSSSFGVLTFTISTAGVYSVSSTTQSQFSTSGTGSGATFNACGYGVLAATMYDNGLYTAKPANDVAQFSTTGTGTSATFTVTWDADAAVGDLLIQPGDSEVIDADLLSKISAVQVAAAGVLNIAPVE